MNNKSKEASYVDDLIGVKKCFSGCVQTTDDRYLTAVEVIPINFKFKTGGEKESIINQFAKWLKIAPIKIQFKTVSKSTDIKKIVKSADNRFNAMKKKYDIPNVKAVDDLHRDEVNLIERLGNREGVERHFYIIMEYIETETYRAKNEEDIVYYLNSAKSSVKQMLHHVCNNTVITHMNDNLFMLELCYEIFNKHKNKFDLYQEWNNIVDRINEYYDFDEEKLDKVEIPYSNLIAPSEIKILSSYCVIDGVYYTFLFVPSEAYPTFISPAWLSGLINSDEGVDVDIFLKKENTNKIRSELRRRTRINKVRIKRTEETSANFEELSKSLYSGDYIKNQLSTGDSFYNMNMMITVSGDSFDSMYSKYARVKELMDSTDVRLMECKYIVDKAIKSYLPLAYVDPEIYNKTRRNITTSDLAAFYPFTSYEVSDDSGTLMGINKDNGTLVVLDLFNKDKYKNANMAILGTSGAGKTYTLGTMLKRMALGNTRTFLIAPLKGHEYYGVCSSVGGQVIRISSGSKDRINIMEIRPYLSDVASKLGFVDNDESILSKKIDSLLVFFSLIITDIKLEEKEALDLAILNTYKKFGITKDNKSLVDHYEEYVDGDGNVRQREVYKKMPILGDLYEELLKDPYTDRIAKIINRYVNGSASSFNGQTNVNLSSPFTVIDISKLSDELLPIGMFIAVDYVWDLAKQNVTEKKVIAIDEAWMLLKNSPQAAKFVVEIFKIIRGYGGSAIAATQDITDFFLLNGGEYGKAVITNSKTKIVLNLEDDEAKTVQDFLNLSNKEKDDIVSFETGNMLVSSNSNTFTLHFLATEIENLMIGTDPKTYQKRLEDPRFANSTYIGEVEENEEI